jgi:hypothetical protein
MRGTGPRQGPFVVSLRRRPYFFLGAGFLAAGFLAAGFFGAGLSWWLKARLLMGMRSMVGF